MPMESIQPPPYFRRCLHRQNGEGREGLKEPLPETPCYKHKFLSILCTVWKSLLEEKHIYIGHRSAPSQPPLKSCFWILGEGLNQLVFHSRLQPMKKKTLLVQY